MQTKQTKTDNNQFPDTAKMSRIERNCYGRNRANFYTIENLKHVLPQLQQFIGKKIKLITGGRSSKFEISQMDVDFIPQIGQTFRTYVHFKYSDGLYLFTDITILTKRYEGGGYGVNYYKTDVRIGTIDDQGVLTEVLPLENIISYSRLEKQYDHNDINSKIEQIEKLKTDLRQLENEVSAVEGNF